MESRIILTSAAKERIEKCKSYPKEVFESIKTVCEKNRTEKASKNDYGKITGYDLTLSGKTYYVAFYRGVVKDDVYFCFRKIYADFEEFKRYTKQCDDTFTQDELVEIETKRCNEKIKQKFPLPETMKIESKLDFKWQSQYIFEMKEWVRSISKYEVIWSPIYDCLKHVIIDGKHSNYHFENDGAWNIVRVKGVFIVYAELNVRGNTYYYLFNIQEKNDITELKQSYVITGENLEHRCKKGYPCLMLCGDLNDWASIEKDEDANLALSEDEIDLMSKRITYPLFVNGLAGSGKSTILYYIFTQVFNDMKGKDRRLIFFSYNDKLIEKAQKTVSNLFKNNALFNDYCSQKSLDNALKSLKKCFISFRKFLKSSFIEDGKDTQQFADDKYMDYDLFCDLYLNKQPYKGQIAPNYKDKLIVVWSVIRCYIKGKFVDKDYTVDDYKNESVRSVSTEVFADILGIYNDWYSKLNTRFGYWDDLDLVKACLLNIDAMESKSDFKDYYIARDLSEMCMLNGTRSDANEMHYKDMEGRLNDILKYKYDVIFCDEAQDFTPIEIKLLLRLSPYIAFDLKQNDKIPIVFAGDPNQTIIPTGFKWNNVKKLFQDVFSENGVYVKISHENLKVNYRSQQSVVFFSNLIQYFRTVLLESSDSVPQDVWNTDVKGMPTFVFEDSDFLEKNCEKFSILTGQDGEYNVDDNGNFTFSSVSPLDDFIETFRDKHKIYTSLSSKGLEFSNVMLYKFVDSSPKFCKNIDFIPNFVSRKIPLSEIENMRLSHFFTKLYIAISRAKDLLVIVDTYENYNNFWCYFDVNSEHFLFESFDENWEKFVNGISSADATIDLEQRLSKNFDANNLAKDFFEKALFSKSEKDMNRAARYYAEAHNIFKKDEALAYAMKFRHEYVDAGNKFKDLNLFSEAETSFWEGRCWTQLIEFNNGVSAFVGKYMQDSISLIDFLKVDKIIDKFERMDDIWNEVVLKIKEDIANVSEDYYVSLTGFIGRLVERGYSILKEDLAEIYYKIGNNFNSKEYFCKAKDLWKGILERINSTLKSHYYDAEEFCAETESDKICLMYEHRKIQEIRTNYLKGMSVKQLDDRANKIIFECLSSDVAYFENALDYIFKEERGISKEEQKSALDKLYGKYPVKFFVDFVMKDITEEKFNDWIIDKVTMRNDLRLFTEANLSKVFFDKIFNKLPDVYLKKLFALRDSRDERVLRRERINVDSLLNSLSDCLTNNSGLDIKSNKFLATCFFDFLFSESKYNFIEYDQYFNTLSVLMSNDIFDGADFMYSVMNPYSSVCNLSLTTIYTIHENVNKYINEKLQSFKNNTETLSDNTRNEVKILINFYKYVLPFDTESHEKKRVDEHALLEFYNYVLGIFGGENEVSDFVKMKIIIERIGKKTLLIRNLFKELDSQNIPFHSLCEAMDCQDCIMVFGYLLAIKYDEVIQRNFVDIAHLIYNNDLNTNNFKFGRTVKYAEKGIDNILSQRVLTDNDLYDLKLLSFARERAKDNPSNNAEFFDNIQKRLPDSRRSYFMRRALHYYAIYDTNESYLQKTKEYRLSTITKDFSLHNVQPVIDIEDKKTDVHYISVKTNDWIDDVEININIERKRILFLNKEGDILLHITSGKPAIQSSTVRIELPKIIVKDDFEITVLSSSEVIIESRNKLYKISV